MKHQIESKVKIGQSPPEDLLSGKNFFMKLVRTYNTFWEWKGDEGVVGGHTDVN